MTNQTSFAVPPAQTDGTLSGSVGLARSTVALLVGVAAFALIFATILGFLHGPFILASGDNETRATSFEFEEANVTEDGIDGQEIERALIISYHSGYDHPQEEVTVRINGMRAFGLDSDAGYYEPWGDPEGTISDGSTEVVIYEEPSVDGMDDDQQRYATIEDGDVVEVVWYEPGSDRMNVLQRYVVGGR